MLRYQADEDRDGQREPVPVFADIHDGQSEMEALIQPLMTGSSGMKKLT
jgi:hypothetical protein